jgi:hypothetical protein
MKHDTQTAFQPVQGNLTANGFGLQYQLDPDGSVDVTVLTGGNSYSGRRNGTLTAAQPQFSSEGAVMVMPGVPFAYLSISIRGDFTAKTLSTQFQVKDTEGNVVTVFNGPAGSWNVSAR